MRRYELSEADVLSLWDAYDVDLSGVLEKEELRAFLEDLTEQQEGHRDFAPEQMQAAAKALVCESTGQISKESFVGYFTGHQLRRFQSVQSG